ncbi:hypothetical protein [Saccharomonospora sp. CUA-673]|uniref:hypothetical protein n=1 Tax=Saccharomonospora sp. CUA-673 TaxID=1904969 RepID=UPI002101408E|nr:hypothetical protein [Saccharomonospora sp. CUA-673]
MARPSVSEHAEWPTNPLDAARDAFAWLTAGDHPVAVDGREFDHLPNREIPVDELRDLLLRRSCPRRVWDQVWRHVITRARSEGSTWTIVAVGLALPMLTHMAARLTDRYAGDPADIHSEIVQGFLDTLQTIDLTTGRITIRLRWAAYRSGHRALIAALDGPTPKAPGFFSAEPKPSSGHPDLVLARAVQVGVLTPTEAEMISETRLGETLLTECPPTTRSSSGPHARPASGPSTDSPIGSSSALTAPPRATPRARRPRPRPRRARPPTLQSSHRV